MTARRVLLFLCTAALMLCSLPFASGEEAAAPVQRALLIGCDDFLTMPAISPAAGNNLRALSRLLEKDSRGYDTIVSCGNMLKSARELEDTVQRVFKNAGENDVSFIYIGTHGLVDEQGRYSFLLSDGKEEEAVEGGTLIRLLGSLPGKKVLILDTCYSGALIGKGKSTPQTDGMLHDPSITVFCAAGAEELSFCFSADPSGDSLAASFFCSALCRALDPAYSLPADLNGDGSVTAEELKRYLPEFYGVSSPCTYPEEPGDSVIFSCGADAFSPGEPLLEGLCFDDSVITPENGSASFSFTLNRACEIFYQIVYWQDGQWQFNRAQQVRDTLDGVPVPAGYRQRALSLLPQTGERSGYVLIDLITSSGDGPQLQVSKLICVQGPEGENKVSVLTAPAFCPENGDELPAVVRHSQPCSVTAQVLDESGACVRLLLCSAPSRPCPENSFTALYWNGLTASGEPAPDGSYTLRVTCTDGENTVTQESEPFLLLASLQEMQSGAYVPSVTASPSLP